MAKEKPITIAQISDFHAGSIYFVPNLISRSIQEINELQPDLVVVTGDLTENGYRQEFKTAKAFLDLIESPNLMVIPGNHDSRNVGYLHFEELFGERSRAMKLEGMNVVGLDSSQPDLDDGRIGRDRYRWIEKCFSSGSGFNIIALHHHLISVPGTGRERNIITDAGDLLDVLVRTGTTLVLSGHKHVPHFWRLEDMILLNAGTCASLRLRGYTKPCYNIIELYSTKLAIYKKYPFGSRELIFKCPTKPLKVCRPGADVAVRREV